MKTVTIVVLEEFKSRCPNFTGCALMAPVADSEFNPELWKEIDAETEWLRREFTTDTVKQRSGILATREGYKACGKDPSRYRPSNEQLCRRLLQGKDLYKVSTLVDLVNLASIRYGYSIGGFDSDKIQGDVLTLGIGRKDEPYEGIGRGMLNIEGMPVYRDEVGGVGTPTSDNERTKLSLDTKHTLCLVNGYDGNAENTRACAEFIAQLLQRYTDTKAEEIQIVQY